MNRNRDRITAEEITSEHDAIAYMQMVKTLAVVRALPTADEREAALYEAKSNNVDGWRIFSRIMGRSYYADTREAAGLAA